MEREFLNRQTAPSYELSIEKLGLSQQCSNGSFHWNTFYCRDTFK